MRSAPAVTRLSGLRWAVTYPEGNADMASDPPADLDLVDVLGIRRIVELQGRAAASTIGTCPRRAV